MPFCSKAAIAILSMLPPGRTISGIDLSSAGRTPGAAAQTIFSVHSECAGTGKSGGAISCLDFITKEQDAAGVPVYGVSAFRQSHAAWRLFKNARTDEPLQSPH